MSNKTLHATGADPLSFGIADNFTAAGFGITHFPAPVHELFRSLNKHAVTQLI